MNNSEMSLQDLEQEINGLKSESENIFLRKTERIKRNITEEFLKNLYLVAERIERAKISSYISSEELDTLSVQLDAISLQATEKLMSEHYVNFDDKFLPYFIEKRKYSLIDVLGDEQSSYIYARPTSDGILAVLKKKNTLANISVVSFDPDLSGFGPPLDLYIDKSYLIGGKIRCLQPLPNNEFLIAGTSYILKFGLSQMDSFTIVAPNENSNFGSEINVVQPMENGLALVGCFGGELYECDWSDPAKPELICQSKNTISGIEIAGDSVFISEGYNERDSQPPFLLKRFHKSGGQWESEIVGKRLDTGFRKIQAISEDSVQAVRWGGVDEFSLNSEGRWSAENVLESTGNFTDVQFLPNGRFLCNVENSKTRKISFGFHDKNRKGTFNSAIEIDNYGKAVPLRDGKLVIVADGQLRLYDGEMVNVKK